MKAALVCLLLLGALGCGPKGVTVTPVDLEVLLACVLEQDDHVERANCVERLAGAR